MQRGDHGQRSHVGVHLHDPMEATWRERKAVTLTSCLCMRVCTLMRKCISAGEHLFVCVGVGGFCVCTVETHLLKKRVKAHPHKVKLSFCSFVLS